MRKDLLDLAVDFGWLAKKTARYSAMTAYQHVGVASDFSPTFTAVLAEAKRFSSHFGADLEIVHAGAFDSEKEKRFFEALGQPTQIRWVQGETIARAIIAAAENFAYELLIAGTLHRETDDKPFAGDVARELLHSALCYLLLVPRPLDEPTLPQHIVFALEPEPEEAKRVAAPGRPGLASWARHHRRHRHTFCRGHCRVARRRTQRPRSSVGGPGRISLPSTK